MTDLGIRYKTALLDNSLRVGIWGSGYIGFTSSINYAMNGVSVLCHDINPEVALSIQKGGVHIPNLEYWLGFPVVSLVNSGVLNATGDWRQMLEPNIKIHLVAVPTERAGTPWDEPLLDVLDKLAQRERQTENPDLVIIESTLTPTTIDRIIIPFLEKHKVSVGSDLLLGIAPRRDWFHSPEKNLKQLPRVFAGTTSNATVVMREVLSIVCDHLIAASNHRIAELVKPVENSLLHIPVVYAMQLARAYPHVDISEVLQLAATHWRIPLYYPSVGTGGYCIPVSSKYVLLGAEEPDCLTLAEEALRFDAEQSGFIAQGLVSAGVRSVGILGICYKGDLKVHTLSPALSIIRHLRRCGVEVKVHDPYYSAPELFEITGCEPFVYPDGLTSLSAVVIVPDHRLYAQTPKHLILKRLASGAIIIDNIGTWSKLQADFSRIGIRYFKIGDAGWTGFSKPITEDKKVKSPKA